jgi:hypothetical protein
MLLSNTQRAKNAILLLWFTVGFKAISIFSDYIQVQVLSDIDRGVIDMPRIEANDSRQMVLAVLWAILLIISASTFIMWFRRAYHNLIKSGEQTQFTEGWAAGAWFTPILNLFRPYQIMIEMYDKTKEKLVANNLIGSSILSKRPLIIWWWILWTGLSIISRITSRLGNNLDTADALIKVTWVEILVDLLAMVSAVLLIKIIQDYSNVEPLLNQTVTEETRLLNERKTNLDVSDLEEFSDKM